MDSHNLTERQGIYRLADIWRRRECLIMTIHLPLHLPVNKRRQTGVPESCGHNLIDLYRGLDLWLLGNITVGERVASFPGPMPTWTGNEARGKGSLVLYSNSIKYECGNAESFPETNECPHSNYRKPPTTSHNQ